MPTCNNKEVEVELTPEHLIENGGVYRGQAFYGGNVDRWSWEREMRGRDYCRIPRGIVTLTDGTYYQSEKYRLIMFNNYIREDGETHFADFTKSFGGME